MNCISARRKGKKWGLYFFFIPSPTFCLHIVLSPELTLSHLTMSSLCLSLNTIFSSILSSMKGCFKIYSYSSNCSLPRETNPKLEQSHQPGYQESFVACQLFIRYNNIIFRTNVHKRSTYENLSSPILCLM